MLSGGLRFASLSRSVTGGKTRLPVADHTKVESPSAAMTSSG